MSITTTEDWSHQYLQRLLVSAKSEAVNIGFPESAGAECLSFCLDALIHDMPSDLYERAVLAFLRRYCNGGRKEIEDYYLMFQEIMHSTKMFLIYVKNTHAEEWIAKHHFLGAWGSGDDGSSVPVC